VNTRTLLEGERHGNRGGRALLRHTSLAILLGAVGLSAWVAGLDYVLIPALAMFIGLFLYALKCRRDDAACCAVPGQADANASGGRQ